MAKGNYEGDLEFNCQPYFLAQDPENISPMNQCMDIYKAKIQSNGSLEKLKLRIAVPGNLQNKDLVGDTW